jgi:hypothetical protein
VNGLPTGHGELFCRGCGSVKPMCKCPEHARKTGAVRLCCPACRLSPPELATLAQQAADAVAKGEAIPRAEPKQASDADEDLFSDFDERQDP